MGHAAAKSLLDRLSRLYHIEQLDYSRDKAQYEAFLARNHSGMWQPKFPEWREWIYHDYRSKDCTDDQSRFAIYNLLRNDKEIAASVGFIYTPVAISGERSDLYFYSGILADDKALGAGSALLSMTASQLNFSNLGVLGYHRELGVLYDELNILPVVPLYSAFRYLRSSPASVSKFTSGKKVHSLSRLIAPGLPLFSSTRSSWHARSRSSPGRAAQFNDFERFIQLVSNWSPPDDTLALSMNRDFIHWRFLERPSINYSVVGWANGQQLAWFVFRIFDSNGYYLTPTVRIIDFGGDIDLVDAVIPKLVQYLRAEFNCHLLYFPVITPQWLPVLKAHGFITRFLEDARLRLDPSLKSDLLNYHITAAWSDVDYQVIAEE